MHLEIPLQAPHTPLLDTIDQPQALRNLTPAQLKQLATELRLFLLYSISQSGGHFGANLGVVELTIALHTIFNTPHDRLVWDVGHQAYPHKVLTGRRHRLHEIRSLNGLAAFPSRHESEYDTFGVGHSSTSISAALGMAQALRYQKRDNRVVCVIGDGAMTAGMAFEALNDLASCQADVMVVLNDNDMSISRSTGGFAEHLAAVWHSGHFVDADENGQPQMMPRPELSFAPREIQPACTENLFSALGIPYYGPFDGHDLPKLLQVFERLKKVHGPKLVHVYTTKGKGFAPAEADPVRYHALTRPATPLVPTPAARKYSDVFGDFLCDQAQADNRLIAITPAMCEGSGMVRFARQFPERFQDVAIAEQHALTLAAGMACEGLKPVVAIYSTFLQRAYDQLIHDIALQNLDVTFGIDRAGLVGEDGPTHAGSFDYAFMRTVPNLVIMAPASENECRQMLHTAYMYPGPAAVRYPRGTGPGEAEIPAFTPLPVGIAATPQFFPGRPEVKSFSPPYRVALLAFGPLYNTALAVAPALSRLGYDVQVVNMRFVKPLDTALLDKIVQSCDAIFTLEEHAVMGGAGSAVNEYLTAHHHPLPLLRNYGLPDYFVDQGSHEELLRQCQLDAASLEQRILQDLSLLAQPGTSTPALAVLQ